MGKWSVSVRSQQSQARPNCRWIVDVRDGRGGRRRLFFATKEEAEAERERKESEFTNHGAPALVVDDRLRADALDANQKLAPLGVSLREVVNEYVRRRGGVSLTAEECAERYLLGQAAKKKKRSKKHLTALRCVFARFARSFPSQRISEITSGDIKGWLQFVGGGAGTFNSYRTLLHALFEQAVDDGACVENPVKRVKREEGESREVGIVTPPQLRKLLMLSTGDVRAVVAIGAFAGIRPEEISRLTWEEVDLGRGIIAVNAAKSKTGRHRYVKILPCLEAWIRPLMGSGSIQGDNFRRRCEEARRAAGFALRGNKAHVGDADEKGLVPWPHDALRHSFASYHLAFYRDAASLALELGHESTKLIFRHYRRRVSEAEAKAYFEVTP